MTVASSKLIKVLLHVFYFGGSLFTQSKRSFPSLVWSYLHFFQLRFDSITYTDITRLSHARHKVTCLYRWLSDCKTKHSWLAYDYWLLLRNFAPVLLWNFYVIAWLTAYDYSLFLRNFAPVLVWNFYGDCLTDYLRLLAFAAKLLRWLSDDIPLWLLGYRKNEWVRSNSGWQALTSAEKNTTRTRYQSGFKK